jgi:hypothetical protein
MDHMLNDKKTLERWRVGLWDVFILISWICFGLAIRRFSATAHPAMSFCGWLTAWFVMGEAIGNFLRQLSGGRFGIGCGGSLGLGFALLAFLMQVATED